MSLYRFNLVLSQNIFSVLSCFEVSLRNRMNDCYCTYHGADWLNASVAPRGMFTIPGCIGTRKVIDKAIRRFSSTYTHNQLLASLDFGFWRYLFAGPQYHAGGGKLLQSFPAKPLSTPSMHINNAYIFNQLQPINDFRNRLAHHEPICFGTGLSIIDSTKIRAIHTQTLQLISWMGYHPQRLLRGIDRVQTLCNTLDAFI
jgi:hypothetical protein